VEPSAISAACPSDKNFPDIVELLIGLTNGRRNRRSAFGLHRMRDVHSEKCSPLIVRAEHRRGARSRRFLRISPSSAHARIWESSPLDVMVFRSTDNIGEVGGVRREAMRGGAIC